MPGRFSSLEFDEDRNDESEASFSACDGQRDGWDLLDQARASHFDGRFEDALRLYTRALQEDRRLIKAWVGQVQMLVELGELHEARVWSDKALELFKNNGELLAAKAQAVARLKDKKTAMACSDGAIQAPGGSPWRWITRGEVLMARGESRCAICFEKALEDPAADWFDRVVIARIYRYYRRTASAMKYLQIAVEMAPAHSHIWYELGICQLELSLLGPAEESLGRCLELNPNSKDAEAALQTLKIKSFGRWIKGVLHRWRSK